MLRGARDARGGLARRPSCWRHSAHPAWFAAAVTTGLKPVVVPVDHDGRAAVGAMTAAIRDDTVLVVASAPSYTHGVVDPVGWLAAATEAKGVALHVDATSGGWSLAYAERAGRVGASWGFAVGGVGSVAVDVGPESAAERPRRGAAPRRGRRAGRGRGDAGRGPLDLPASWTRPGPLLADVVETLHEIGHDGCAELAATALDPRPPWLAATLDLRGVARRGPAGRHGRGPCAATPPATRSRSPTPCTCAAGRPTRCCRRPGRRCCASRSPRRPRRSWTTWSRRCRRRRRGPGGRSRAHRPDARAAPGAARPRRHRRPDRPPAARRRRGHRRRPGHPGRRSATNLLLAAAAPGVRETLLAVHHDRLLRPVPPLAQEPATSACTVDSE